MNSIVIMAISTVLTMSDSQGIFGNINYRSAAAVAADVDAVGRLTGASFDDLAPNVLAVVKVAKSSALRIHAMDVLAANVGPDRATELIAYLNECLDGFMNDKDRRKHTIVGAFVTSNLANWGNGLRTSPATLAFFRRLTTSTDRGLDARLCKILLDTTLQLAPSDTERRSILLEIIANQSTSSGCAAERVAALLDDGTRQTLRTFAASQPFNRAAIEALAEAGDAAALSIVQQQRDRAQAAGSERRVNLQFLDQSIRKINLANSPDALVRFIRSPGDEPGTMSLHLWAIRRARALNIDLAQIRNAILQWAGTAEAWEVAPVKEYSQEVGVLQSNDLPGASQPSAARVLGQSVPQRRLGPVEVPDRRANAERWRPNVANYDAFFSWYSSQDRQAWRALTEAERESQIRRKLCELNLISPDACEGVASSQATPP